MTLRLIAADNGITTLGSSLSSTATTLTVSTGTGANFPVVTSGVNYFLLTLSSAGSTTGIPNEIVQVTARSGDSMTIVRGQEGTTPSNWNVGDTVSNQFTSGSMATFAQQVDVQEQPNNQSNDSGTANAAVVTLGLVPATQVALVGVPIRVFKVSSANTGATTLNVNSLGAQPVTLAGAALYAGALAASQWFEVLWDGTSYELQTTPAVIAPTGPAGGDLSGNYPNPDIAEGVIVPNMFTPPSNGTVLADLGSGVEWAALSALLTALGITVHAASTGHIVIGGVYIQWGTAGPYSYNSGFQTVDYDVDFPTACWAVALGQWKTSPAVDADSAWAQVNGAPGQDSFSVLVNSATSDAHSSAWTIMYIAIGN